MSVALLLADVEHELSRRKLRRKPGREYEEDDEDHDFELQDKPKSTKERN